MQSEFEVGDAHALDGYVIDTALAPFFEAMEMVRQPKNPLAVQKMPHGRAIARIDKPARKRADQPAVSFGNWCWAIEPGTPR
jgi:hypothetical protein